MNDASIIIEAYNPKWPEMFQQEQQRLQAIVSPWLAGGIEHVGSTAVNGLSAKPVIDIMVGVKSLYKSKAAITALVESGYCYYPYKTEVMHWFCKPSPEIRTHHLHLIPFNSPLWHERLKFRDLLRTNQQLASQYQVLKLALAEKFQDDREAYTKHKWPFIKKALKSDC